MSIENNKCTHWLMSLTLYLCQTIFLYRQEANLKRNHEGMIWIHLNHDCLYVTFVPLSMWQCLDGGEFIIFDFDKKVQFITFLISNYVSIIVHVLWLGFSPL
jgi:hypothetical protein